MNLLQQFKEHLFSQKTAVSHTTTKNYLADVKRFISWFELKTGKPFEPSIVTGTDITDYRLMLLGSEKSSSAFHIKKSFNINPVSTSSAERYISSLRKFFHFLNEKEITATNPFSERIHDPRQEQLSSWKIQEFKNALFTEKAADLTVKNYIIDVLQFLDWLSAVGHAGKTNPASVFTDISQKTIDEYKYRLFHLTHLSPSSINRKLSSLRKYFTWSNEAGMLQQVFLVTSKLPQAQYANLPLPDAIMTDEELLTPLPRTEVVEPEYVPQGFFLAPLRVFSQTTLVGKYLATLAQRSFDATIIYPFVATYQRGATILWKLRGTPVFASDAKEDSQAPSLLTFSSHTEEIEQESYSPARLILSNIKKEFYAPLAIATASMPGHARLMHFMTHTRPKWYKKYHNNAFVHYAHFAILLFITALSGMVLYDHMMPKDYQNRVLSAQTANGTRLLSFQGKLTDTQGGAITSATDLRFSVYTDPIASQGALLWQETQRIKPASNGSFTTLLGQNIPLPETLANDTRALYLGLTVGQGKELLPRQHLTTSAFAGDSHKVQGMVPITASNAGNRNVLLALDSTGSLTIGGNASPVFQATGGEFTLTGESLLLSTNPGSSGDIILAPDGLGKIDIQKQIHNASEYNSITGVAGAVEVADTLVISATESAQSALIVNQNGTGNIISALSSGIAKFTLSYLGAATLADSLTVDGQDIGTSQTSFNLLNNNVINLNIARSATEVSIGASSGKTIINNEMTEVRGNLGVLGTKGISIDAPDAGIIFSGNGTHTISAKSGRLALDAVNLSGNVSLAKDVSITPQTADGVNNLGSASFPFDNLYVNNIISPSLNAAANYVQLINNVLSPITSTNDFAIGGSNTSNASFFVYGSGANNGTASTSGALTFKQSGTINQLNGNNFTFQTSPGGDAGLTPKVTISGSGNVGIGVTSPLYSLQLATDSAAKPVSNTWTVVSDTRLKENIASFSDGLRILSQINPVSYTLNGKGGMTKGLPGIGILAQDVKDILPYTIGTFRAKLNPTDTEETELLSFNSSALTFVAINAIKELDQKILRQETVFSELQNVLTSSSLDNLDITPQLDGSYILTNTDSSVVQRTAGFTRLVAASFLGGLIETRDMLITGQINILGMLRATTIMTQSITSQLFATSEAFVSNTLSANSLVARRDITSPLASIDRLQTNLLSPLSPDAAIALELKNDKIIVKNGPTGSNSAVAVIDNQGNASFSGTLRAKKIIADEIGLSDEALAKLEGLPKQSSPAATYITNVTNVYNSIESSTSGALLTDSTPPTSLIDEEASASAQAQNEFSDDIAVAPLVTDYNSIPPLSSVFSNVPTLTTEFATITKGLMVFGPTSVSDLSSAGQIAIGGNMILADGGINVLTGDLELQPLRQGGISFLGGKIKFDIQGNITVEGDANFAKNVTIQGTLSASLIRPIPENDLTLQFTDAERQQQLLIKNASGSSVLRVSQAGDLASSGSGLFKQLAANAFKVVRSAQADTTSTETTATASAGTVIIPKGFTEKTILTPFATQDALIYLTPTSDTQQTSPYVARQTAHVAPGADENLPEGRQGSFTVRISSPVLHDIQLNWWIIN